MPGKSVTIIRSIIEYEELRYVTESLPLAAAPGHSALSGGPRESAEWVNVKGEVKKGIIPPKTRK